MKRTESHVIGEEAVKLFKDLLPAEWLDRIPNRDYGEDLEFQIVENSHITKWVFWVQSKGTKCIKPSKKIISATIKTKKLKDWEDSLLPVIIVRPIISKKACYIGLAQECIRELDQRKPPWRNQDKVAVRLNYRLGKNREKNGKIIKQLITNCQIQIFQRELALRVPMAFYSKNGIITYDDDDELRKRTLKALDCLINGRYQPGIKEIENILLEFTLSPVQRLFFLINLGNSCFIVSDYNTAYDVYKAAQKNCKKVDEEDRLRGESCALMGMGLISLYVKSELNQARDTFNRALELIEEIRNKSNFESIKKIENKINEANIRNNLGNVYKKMYDLEKAAENWEKANAIFQEIGNKQGESITQGNLFYIFLERGNLEECIKRLDLAIDLARETGYKLGEANHLENKGMTYYLMNKQEEAEKYVMDALKIYQKIGSRYGEARVFFCMSLISEKKGKSNTAYKYSHKALSIFSKMGCKLDMANTLMNMVFICEKDWEFDKALGYCKKVYKIYDALNLRVLRDEVQKKIDELKIWINAKKRAIDEAMFWVAAGVPPENIHFYFY